MTDDDREIITPAAGLVERGEHAGPQLAVGDAPERVLLAWGRALLETAVRYARAEDSGKRVAEAPLFVGKWGGARVGIVGPGIGAPATALAVEKLGAAGAKVFVGAGFHAYSTPSSPSASGASRGLKRASSSATTSTAPAR